MKKKTFLLLFIALFGLSFYQKEVVKVDSKKYYSPATEAGFESEAFYRCVLDTLGEERDSASDEELAQITEVICRSSHIESTAGIEKLTALRYLNLYDNDVTSMDLSHNTNLVMLNMTFNDLNSIDLSHNTNLQQLYLNGNNISSIDLSHNTLLIDLNIYNNALGSIDVSMLPNLKFLLLSLNNLSSIDLTNNNILEHVYLSGNQLSEIKMPTNAPNLTRLDLNANELTSINLATVPNLEYVITSANKLTSLDVSNNSELKYLYSSSNQLSSIDLTYNTKIIDLDLYNNKLTNLDISKLTALRYLNVSLNKLTALNLDNNTNLEKLYASSNQLSSLSLANQNNLKEINVVFNLFDGYTINHKENITYMVVDYDWLKDMNLNEFTNLAKLDIDYYKRIYVAEDNTTISYILKFVPKDITLNSYDVYKGFGNISNKSISVCKYDVDYVVSGANSTTETTTIDTCSDDSFAENNLTSKETKMQIFSTDFSINNFTTSADLQFNAYYEISYNSTEVVDIPNTSAFVSIISIILGILGISIGSFFLVSKYAKNNQS